MFNAGAKIVENEGIGALVLGAQATIVGYFWYGFSVYPTYTFLKRFLSSSSSILPLDYAMAHGNEIALVAGAGAAVVASLGLTPIEAARIRVVANPTEYKPLGLLGTLRVIATEQNNNCNDDDSHQSWKGWRNLYAGLPSLLTRQVVFGSIKFLAFERACDFLFAAGPFLREATWTTLAVSLVAGGWSGVISSVVSQPADSVLTYVSKQQGKTNKTIVLDPTFTANPNKNTGSNNINEYNNNLNLLDGARRIVDEDGPGALFRGLQSRCVWAGSIIAGQFLLYDVFRTVFGVSAVDLTQVFEITMEVSSVSQN